MRDDKHFVDARPIGHIVLQNPNRWSNDMSPDHFSANPTSADHFNTANLDHDALARAARERAMRDLWTALRERLVRAR